MHRSLCPFTYDPVGNRTTEAGVDGEWEYNANNELLTFADTEYVYDDIGQQKWGLTRTGRTMILFSVEILSESQICADDSDFTDDCLNHRLTLIAQMTLIFF